MAIFAASLLIVIKDGLIDKEVGHDVLIVSAVNKHEAQDKVTELVEKHYPGKKYDIKMKSVG